MVIDGDYIPEPDFNLNRIVEHAVVRSKDTLTYVTLAPEMGANVSDHTILDLERNPGGHVTSNPEVLAVHPFPDGSPGSTRSKTAMGPVVFLRRSTLPLIKQFFAEAGKTRPLAHHTPHAYVKSPPPPSLNSSVSSASHRQRAPGTL